MNPCVPNFTVRIRRHEYDVFNLIPHFLPVSIHQDHIFTGDIAFMLKQPETAQISKVVTQKGRTKR